MEKSNLHGTENVKINKFDWFVVIKIKIGAIVNDLQQYIKFLKHLRLNKS